MCARYRMVRNPNPTGDKKKQALHPRVVPYGTIRTNDLIEEAEARSGMSGADLKGALRVIADVMASRLDQGLSLIHISVLRKIQMRGILRGFQDSCGRCLHPATSSAPLY